jgi:hypothetical protein
MAARSTGMILRSPPLCRLSSFLEQEPPAVAVRLAEPFWGGDAHLRMLVRCVQLHTLLECEAVEHSQPSRLEDICAARPRVRQLLESLCDDADLMHAGPSPMALLESSGLACMCPLVSHYLGEPDKVRL